MEKLNFPVFEDPMPPPPTLSMDQYLEVVEFNLKHTSPAVAWERRTPVDLRFRLKKH